MEMSEKKNEIFKALNIFRKKLKQPVKDKTNPFFRSTYVDLSGVTKSIDEALDGTGLAYFQNPLSGVPENTVGIETIITHESGQYIKCDPFIAPVMPNKKGNRTAQEFGSAKTYASRYSLASAFGISDGIDDDGNSASNNQASSNNNYKNQQKNSSRNTNDQHKPQGPTAEQLNDAKNKIAAKCLEMDKLSNLTSGTTSSLVIEKFNYNPDTADANKITEVFNFLKGEIKKMEQKQAQGGVAND